MKVGYLRKTDADNILKERLEAQGAETVICDTGLRETVPALLDSLSAGDTLYLWSLWHLSRREEEVKTILDQLHKKGVRLYIHGEFIDFKDKRTQFELQGIYDYHNETMHFAKAQLDSLKRLRTRTKQQKDG